MFCFCLQERVDYYAENSTIFLLNAFSWWLFCHLKNLKVQLNAQVLNDDRWEFFNFSNYVCAVHNLKKKCFNWEDWCQDLNSFYRDTQYLLLLSTRKSRLWCGIEILQSFCWMRFLDDFSVILKTWKLNLMLKFWMTTDENFLISVITLALSTT